ncbi:EamA family transporter, partial [Glaciimonas sp. GG7]
MQPTDILLALLTVSIWGFNFVVIKIGLQDLPPLLFSAMRFTFAAIPLIFFIKRPAIPWRLLVGYGVFQFALQFALLFSGMKLGFSAGLASLVIQLQAFFTIGLAVLILGERPRAAQLIGALIALLGMALVAIHVEGSATLIGFLLVVIAGVSWASANIVTKTIGKVNPLALVVWGSLIAIPPLLLASILVEGPAAWGYAAIHLSWLSAAAVLFQSYPNTIETVCKASNLSITPTTAS